MCTQLPCRFPHVQHPEHHSRAWEVASFSEPSLQPSPDPPARAQMQLRSKLRASPRLQQALWYYAEPKAWLPGHQLCHFFTLSLTPKAISLYVNFFCLKSSNFSPIPERLPPSSRHTLPSLSSSRSWKGLLPSRSVSTLAAVEWVLLSAARGTSFQNANITSLL